MGAPWGMPGASVPEWSDPIPDGEMAQPSPHGIHSDGCANRHCRVREGHASGWRHAYKPIPSIQARTRARTHGTGKPSATLKRRAAVYQALGIPVEPWTLLDHDGREAREAREELRALFPDGLPLVHDGPPPRRRGEPQAKGRLVIRSAMPSTWDVARLEAKAPKEAR